MNQKLNQEVSQYLEKSEAYLEGLETQLAEQKKLRHTREMAEVDAQVDMYYGMRGLLREQSISTLQAEGLIAAPTRAPVKKIRRAYNFA
jgi:hypothetical protein